MLLNVLVRSVCFGGYFSEPRYVFIVHILRRTHGSVILVGDDALISGFGKGPLGNLVARSFCLLQLKLNNQIDLRKGFWWSETGT